VRSSSEAFHLHSSLELDPTAAFADRGTPTSYSSEAVDNSGERWVSRNLVHSRSSFSFNTWRGSGMERSWMASGDTVVVTGKQHQTTSFCNARGVFGAFPIACGSAETSDAPGGDLEVPLVSEVSMESWIQVGLV
jgi:hypothetical protein